MGALSRGSGGGGGGGTAAGLEAEPEGQHRPNAILLSGKLRGKVHRGKVSWPPDFSCGTFVSPCFTIIISGPHILKLHARKIGSREFPGEQFGHCSIPAPVHGFAGLGQGSNPHTSSDIKGMKAILQAYNSSL